MIALKAAHAIMQGRRHGCFHHVTGISPIAAPPSAGNAGQLSSEAAA